jgi:3-oxoacyl-(acyl-carrier-protein) synthase
LLHFKKTYFCQKLKILQEPISITAIQSISPLGKSLDEIWDSYTNDLSVFKERQGALVSEISETSKAEIDRIKASDTKYNKLDNSVLYAIFASRNAIDQAGWNGSDNFGINIGSSRGATALFENYYADFLKQDRAETLSSPTTTLGNISSWVAHDLQTQGPEISHSITCSTALHALLNGIAWLQSGMCDKFLVGGSEAPLTPFTIAQMKALNIYATTIKDYPCRAMDLSKSKNGMILGEAASMACLEKGNLQGALAVIAGIGYATEPLTHNVSLSTDAKCFQKSMTMALGDLNPEEVDVIITHAPGTIKGDLAEIKAIKKVFCNKVPSLSNNKWKLGHTLGASGMLSIEMAVLILQNQKYIPVPYLDLDVPKRLKYILINAVGFGGNAVSVLLSK